MRRGRTVVPEGQLFLGVLVDCSGSMSGAPMEQAIRFAVQTAEAVRGVAQVRSRFAGFTGSTWFDCGTAANTGVAALTADGGNNDAGALARMAAEARRSGCRSRAILMISDGSPTECSVAALRALVRRVERDGIACVQVALREIPMEERCFGDYVEIINKPPIVAVREFASVVTKVAQRAWFRS